MFSGGREEMDTFSSRLLSLGIEFLTSVRPLMLVVVKKGDLTTTHATIMQSNQTSINPGGDPQGKPGNFFIVFKLLHYILSHCPHFFIKDTMLSGWLFWGVYFIQQQINGQLTQEPSLILSKSILRPILERKRKGNFFTLFSSVSGSQFMMGKVTCT